MAKICHLPHLEQALWTLFPKDVVCDLVDVQLPVRLLHLLRLGVGVLCHLAMRAAFAEAAGAEM